MKPKPYYLHYESEDAEDIINEIQSESNDNLLACIESDGIEGIDHNSYHLCDQYTTNETINRVIQGR